MSEDPVLLLLGEMRDDLLRIEGKVDKTNGRVTSLELWRHGLAAVAASRSWIKPWLLGVLSGAVVAAVSVGIAAAFAAIT